MTILADTGLWTNAWYYLSWVVPFLFVLSVVVFVHEMGHFMVARFFGVTVETFSIGFGPEIAGFYDRYGTRWRVAVLPLGGYVKFKGDENAASVPSKESLAGLSPAEREGNFHAKPVGQRAAIVAAGPIANFILAIVILTFWFALVGKPILEPRVATIEPGSAAAEAGFQVDDVIRSIDGSPIESFEEIQRSVMMKAGTPLSIVVDRKGQLFTLEATPRLKEMTDRMGHVMQIGLLGVGRKNENVTVKQFTPVGAFAQSLSETYFFINQPLVFIKRLVLRQPGASGDQLGGLISIAQLSREVASVGFSELIRWIAIISVNIGLLNLFPIPILDGGHLLFYGIEAIRGRPLSERTMEIGFRIGFALVIMLMLFATRNDVIHLIRQTG